jgi:hypothetical protein
MKGDFLRVKMVAQFRKDQNAEIVKITDPVKVHRHLTGAAGLDFGKQLLDQARGAQMVDAADQLTMPIAPSSLATSSYESGMHSIPA